VDIPLASRIIAVADSFDSLTRARPGRQALPSNRALQVVESRAGTHLDPTVVAVLARVLERHTWAVAEPPPEGAGAPLWDHDDPVMSDMLAGIDRPAIAGQGS
jgi:HD-GYP domain-containing protein (c-di-GMP phosphodiesterase class II)